MEHNDLQYAAPGGLIGVGTKIESTLCWADRMVGQVLDAVEALPEIVTELEISYFLLRRLLGVRTEGDKKAAKVSTFCNFSFKKSDSDVKTSFEVHFTVNMRLRKKKVEKKRNTLLLKKR